MSGNAHNGHRDRMRERFLQEGPDGLADHELLEMLLYGVIPRGNTNPMAHGLLEEFGSFSNLLEADPVEIAKASGVGMKTAVFLALLHELARRYQREKLKQKDAITSSMRAAAYCCALMAHCVTERFYVICLDSRRRVIHTAKVAEGTVVETIVYPRTVMEVVLRHRATGVVFCHNHPGGNVHPSFDDISLTIKLRKMLDMVGIPVVDHIIVGENKYFSFSENDMLKAEETDE